MTAFVAGIALLRMHPRGWLLGMVAAVIVLAVQLVSWYDATPNYILMAFAVAVVLLMNQAEVRDAFGEEAQRVSDATTTPTSPQPSPVLPRSPRSPPPTGKRTWRSCAATSRSSTTRRASCSSRPRSISTSPGARSGRTARAPAGTSSSCPPGSLSVDNLAEPHTTEFGAVEFLRRVEDVDLATQARALLAGSAQDLPESERFHPGAGRLARVGYVSRLIDAVFTLSLLVRGHTPGAVVAASARAYREALAEDERYVYYGRVVRGGGWVALQYRFFFYFNDYRSTFDGVDDHEADWEMALVYLSTESRRASCSPSGSPMHVTTSAATTCGGAGMTARA